MTARIELLACKNRKTNEIWLLGEVSESGTLKEVDTGGQEKRWHGSTAWKVPESGWFFPR
jgi:hypothetical protein